LLGSRKTQLMVAKDIVYTLASNQSMNSSLGVTKTLGVDRWNIKRAMGKRVQLDIIPNALWINQRQPSHSNALPQEIRDVVKHLEEHPKHFVPEFHK
jgi:hypothetical protein